MLRVRLLGGIEVDLEGAVLETKPSQRPWALLGYLALSPNGVTRSELANTFWPDVLDTSARASLRSALWALRRALGDWVSVEGERVGLRADGLWVDFREFERRAEDGELEGAIELCRGDLLAGVEDEWAILARDRHRQRVIDLLERLATDREEHGDLPGAIESTRRQADTDPLDEGAARRLIARLGAAGEQAAAQRVYRTLADRLRRELGVAPSPHTREQLENVRAAAAKPTPVNIAVEGLGSLPLAGRDRERAQLDRVWSAVTNGAGAAALVHGEAGIGKSRLGGELRRHAHESGALTASGAALDLGGAAPLSLWAELIRDLAARIPAPPSEAAWPEDLSPLAPELPGRFGRSATNAVEVAPDLQRTRLFEAVVALIEWSARVGSVLLVFEDIHVADPPTLELAGYVARRISALPVMMLFTRRELPRSGAADRLVEVLRSRGVLGLELSLGPLPRSPVITLARSAAALNDADAERVAELAEGNPLLAIETARVLASGADEVAPSIRGSVRATIAGAPREVRELIELTAVAGRAIEPVELQSLQLADPEEHAAAALETALLVSAERGLEFRHPLLRDALYTEIAEPRRRGLHLRWAEALIESEREGAAPRPAEVARHLRLAGRDRAAIGQLARAAAEARGVAALEQAADYLQEAIAIEPDRHELLLELGEVEAWRGRREQAEDAFERVLRLVEAGDPLELARALLKRARAYHGPICAPRLVLENCRRALELLAGCDEPAGEEHHEALAACAWAEAVAGSVEQAERLLAELGQSTAGDLDVYDVSHARAFALMRRGRFSESYGPSIAAGEAIARAGRPDLSYGCWVNAAGAAAAIGSFDRALEFLDRGQAAVGGRGMRGPEAHLLAARSFVLIRLGRLEEAAEATRQEALVAEQLEAPDLIAMARHDSGVVALEAGAYADAVPLLSDALVDGAPISRPLTRLALAEAQARSGSVQDALAQVRATVLEPVRPSDFPDALVPRLARVQGLIAQASGDLEGARARLRESIEGWERVRERTSGSQQMTVVLADLGRPVVGLVEPERELARAREELKAIEGRADALVP